MSATHGSLSDGANISASEDHLTPLAAQSLYTVPVSFRHLENCRKLPNSWDTFTSIRENNLIYVDKTLLIYYLARLGGQYLLLRPSGFGKTLMLSTFDAYFRGKAELFQDLAISHLETEWKKYPILSFDFSDMIFTDPASFDTNLRQVLNDLASEHDVKIQGSDVGSLFRSLMREVHTKFGEPCVVLVDEYDKPILNMQKKFSRKDLVMVYTRFFNALKTKGDHVHFALVAGTVNFNSAALFGDNNRIVDISAEPEYSAICGFTARELRQHFTAQIQEVAEQCQINESDCCDQLIKENGGYCFVPNCDKLVRPSFVYNSFRHLKIERRMDDPMVSILSSYMQKENIVLVDYANGIVVRETELKSLPIDEFSALSLFYQCGYLTVLGQDNEAETYLLRYPNSSAVRSLVDILTPAMLSERSITSASRISEIMTSIEEGNVNEYVAWIQQLYQKLGRHLFSCRTGSFQNAFQLSFMCLDRICTVKYCTSKKICCILTTNSRIWVVDFRQDTPAKKIVDDIITSRNWADLVGSSPVILLGVNVSSGKKETFEYEHTTIPANPSVELSSSPANWAFHRESGQSADQVTGILGLRFGSLGSGGPNQPK